MLYDGGCSSQRSHVLLNTCAKESDLSWRRLLEECNQRVGLSNSWTGNLIGHRSGASIEQSFVPFAGGCPLCMREVNMLRKRDAGVNKIAFVDIDTPDYTPAQNAGISYEQV